MTIILEKHIILNLPKLKINNSRTFIAHFYLGLYVCWCLLWDNILLSDGIDVVRIYTYKLKRFYVQVQKPLFFHFQICDAVVVHLINWIWICWKEFLAMMHRIRLILSRGPLWQVLEKDITAVYIGTVRTPETKNPIIHFYKCPSIKSKLHSEIGACMIKTARIPCANKPETGISH